MLSQSDADANADTNADADADADVMQVVTTSTEELREFLPAPVLTICPTFGNMLFGFPR